MDSINWAKAQRGLDIQPSPQEIAIPQIKLVTIRFGFLGEEKLLLKDSLSAYGMKA